jgi:hypothetical protein
MPLVRAATGVRVVKILAPLACYGLGLQEVEAAGSPPGEDRYGAGAGMRARTTFGTSAQPSMCWQVRIQCMSAAHRFRNVMF